MYLFFLSTFFTKNRHTSPPYILVSLILVVRVILLESSNTTSQIFKHSVCKLSQRRKVLEKIISQFNEGGTQGKPYDQSPPVLNLKLSICLYYVFSRCRFFYAVKLVRKGSS